MIVFMVLSGRKRKAQAAEMASKVLPGSKIMLTSGIYGEVISVDEDRITIKSAGNTTLEVAKGAVARVVEIAPEKKPSAAKKSTAKPSAAKK
jgi:preprotein translocase subunit YajC